MPEEEAAGRQIEDVVEEEWPGAEEEYALGGVGKGHLVEPDGLAEAEDKIDALLLHEQQDAAAVPVE